MSDGIFGGLQQQLVGHLIHLGHTKATAFGNSLGNIIPDRLHIF